MAWTELDSTTTSGAESGIAYSVLQARVIAGCDNLPSTHPHYTYIPTYINEAKDQMLTMALGMSRKVLDLLPRLRNWRWYDTTVNAQHYLALPERMLTLEAMSYTKSTAAVNLATTRLYPSYQISEDAAPYDTASSKTETGWPTRWRRAGSRIELSPVPTTAYLTNIVVYGTRLDRDLVQSADTLLMDPRLQAILVDYATAYTMEKMRWDEAASEMEKAIGKLQRMLSIGGEEKIRGRLRLRIAGTPQ